MVIDTHAHYLPGALLGALEKRERSPRVFDRDGRPFIEYGERSAQPLTPAFTDVDVLLERMREAGIDHSVLSVTIPGVDWFDLRDATALARDCNAEMAELCRSHPDQISGLATVPLQFPELAVDVLQSAVRDGLKGAMIYSNVAGGHLDDPDRRQFFDAAAELDAPILLHPTYPLCAPTVAVHGMLEIAGFLFDTTTAALRLVFDGLYERHPDFKFIVPHAASLIPYFVGRIDHFGVNRPGSAGDLTGLPSDHIRRFFTDTVCNWPPAIRLSIDFFGVDKIMLGSDHPFWPMSIAKNVLDDLELSASDRAKIEFENAVRLFQLSIPSAVGT
ncbi:MAG TPA: amidohydrolase family protein [Acidimicrobiales bacterium]|nr:amidohydrolase family protein [Acidimicrobiales bacterium]